MPVLRLPDGRGRACLPGDERPRPGGGLIARRHAPAGDDPAAPLRAGELVLAGLMPGASNYTFLAELRDGDRASLVVYKPQAGESPLWDFPDGTLYRREVAAYETARLLGWDLVPPTVARYGPHGVGAVQRYVVHDPAHHYLTMHESRLDEFRLVCAFDIVINNADRKSGHCLLDAESGRIRLIDHGVAFHAEPKLRTVIWEFAGEPLPDEAMAALKGLLTALDGPTALDGLLDPAEREALARRTERLLTIGAFPEPGPGRPYPWPPV